jgi:hypothetical protein
MLPLPRAAVAAVALFSSLSIGVYTHILNPIFLLINTGMYYAGLQCITALLSISNTFSLPMLLCGIGMIGLVYWAALDSKTFSFEKVKTK